MESSAARGRFEQSANAKSASDDDGAALLHRFVAATTEEDADVHLGRLLHEYARPLIRKVVARSTRGGAIAAEGDDLVAETVAQLLKRFRDLRRRGSPPIADLRAYIFVAARRRCDEFLRASQPARARLAKRIRYLFLRRPDLAIWRTSSGRLLCGFRDGKNARSGTSAPPRGGKELAMIERLIAHALHRAAEPVPFETLVDEVARAAGEVREPLEIPLERARDAVSRPEQGERLSIRDLWRDLARLPRGQRVALMLNLRDPAAREPVSLLPLMETATFPEIAAMLSLPQSELAPIWEEIPLDDTRIASLLGVTQREVVKLRRLARERLWRRRDASVKHQ